MASLLLRSVFISIFIYSILLLSHSVQCDHDEEDWLLQSINGYRASLNLKALQKNKKAECLADEVAEQFQNQPCARAPGTEPSFANYTALLTKCRLSVSSAGDGAVLPACVPYMESSLVVSNFTRSRYSDYLNDTKFTGVGIGREDDWIVVVLTTSTPAGSFVPAKNAVDDDVDDHDDRNDDHDDRDDKNDDVDDRKGHDHDHDHDDEEDILLQGINAHRATSNAPALIKTKAADCFADEFADRFRDQQCSNTTGSVTAPATTTGLSGYPDLLFKCGLNASDGIVLPACAPNSAPSIVLTSLKSSKYSASLADPKFTGVGIGSEDDWLVVVMTSNTTAGATVPPGTTPNTPNPFNKANAVDGVSGISSAGFVPEVSFVPHFLVLLVTSIFLI